MRGSKSLHVPSKLKCASFFTHSECSLRSAFFPATRNLFEHKMISLDLNEIDNHFNKFILPFKWPNWRYS